MPELTQRNVEQISNEIIKQEVSCSQLFLVGVLMFMPALMINILKAAEKTKFKAVIITTFIGIVLYNLGFLFKIQHWPFATIMILIGTVVIGFIAIPWYTRLAWNTSTNSNADYWINQYFDLIWFSLTAY